VKRFAEVEGSSSEAGWAASASNEDESASPKLHRVDSSFPKLARWTLPRDSVLERHHVSLLLLFPGERYA